MTPNPYESPAFEEPLVRAELADDDDNPTMRMFHRTMLGVALTVTAVFAAKSAARHEVDRVGLAIVAAAGFLLSAKQSDYEAMIASLRR